MVKAASSCNHSHRVLSANLAQAHSLLRSDSRFLPGSLPACPICEALSAAIFFISLTSDDESSMNRGEVRLFLKGPFVSWRDCPKRVCWMVISYSSLHHHGHLPEHQHRQHPRCLHRTQPA